MRRTRARTGVLGAIPLLGHDKGGIYYAESEPEPVLKFLRFQDRKTVVIAPLAKPPSRAERGLAVSANGRLILYVQVDTICNQIMVAPMPQ